MIGHLSVPRPLLGNLGRLATSFAVLHAANAAISMGYNVIQLFVFARVLAPERYSAIILLTALSFYVLPVSQAIGRANFVALRGGEAGTPSERLRAQAVAAMYAHGLMLVVVACLAPSLVAGSVTEKVESAFYVGICLINNFWYYDLQTTYWALDRGKAFERVTVIRRLTMFLALPLLWLTGHFLLYVVLLLAIIVAFAVHLARAFPSDAAGRLTFDRRALTAQGALAYLRLFWPALLSSLTELVVLNAPYAIFAAAFGTGPAIVAYDTIMKLARFTMSVARNLSESALPRLARMITAGDRRGVGRLLALLVGICGIEGVVVGAILVAAGPAVFRLLLGPNDVLPPGTQYVAAAIVLIGCLYQPVTFFLVFNGGRAAINRMTLIAALGMAALAGLALSGWLDLMAALEAYAVFFAAVTALALGLCFQFVRGLRVGAPATSDAAP